MSGGTMTTAVLSIGTFGGSNGTLNLNGGVVSATLVQLGGGAGTINFNGGAFNYGALPVITGPGGVSLTDATVSPARVSCTRRSSS